MTDPTTNGEEPTDAPSDELASLKRENSAPDEDPESDPESDDGDRSSVTRRAVLGGTVAILGTGGWLAYAVERVKAAVASGDVGTAANPYRRAYVTTVNFEDLGADPASPDDGAMWYNSNA